MSNKRTVDRTAVIHRLQHIRQCLELNKTTFAVSIGISKSNYSQIESGARMLTVDQIYTIFMTYGVPMDYLVAGRAENLPGRFR